MGNRRGSPFSVVMRVIELVEYGPKALPRDELTQEVAEKIWRKFEKQISIEPPSFQTGYNWQLTSRGYVGFLPIDEDLTLAIRPKVPLKSLFGMLEYAYQLDFK